MPALGKTSADSVYLCLCVHTHLYRQQTANMKNREKLTMLLSIGANHTHSRAKKRDGQAKTLIKPNRSVRFL